MCRPITFRWLLLFIAFTQVVFREKVLLKLPHLITFLLRLDQSNETHFAASWWALIIKGRCNTLCSNDISLNVTLISTAYHWIVSSQIKKKIFDGSGESGNTAMKLFSYYCHFQVPSVATTIIFNLSFTAIKYQTSHQILIKLRMQKVSYEDPRNKTDWFMKKLVC